MSIIISIAFFNWDFFGRNSKKVIVSFRNLCLGSIEQQATIDGQIMRLKTQIEVRFPVKTGFGNTAVNGEISSTGFRR